MSVQALSLAFAVRGLSPSEKLVLLALANFANERMQCWPSQDRLAEDTELGSRTVWGALKGLEAHGLLTRTSRKRDDGTRTTDVFTLDFGTAQPVAIPAKPTRKSCEVQSQHLREPVAAVATLTTFEPSVNHQKEEPVEAASSAARAKRRSRMCPAEWVPSPADLAVGAGEGLTPGEMERELAKFRDYEFRTPHSQWSATFRTWLRNAAERKPANVRTGSHHPAPSSRAAGRGIWAEIAAKERAEGIGGIARTG